MSVTRCMFCDAVLQPSQYQLPSSSTEEHVYAKWYRENVVNNKIKMFTATLGGEAKLIRQPPLERLVNTSVCAACNNGWMSKLETDAAPIITSLCNGRDIRELTTLEVDVLARWAGKTAAVMSFVTPEKARVPRAATLSLHPNSRDMPKMRVFYAHISADLTLEGGYLQVLYGPELRLIGTEEVSGTRITLCVYNHCLTVDFPPIMPGVMHDLSESCSAQIWPQFVPAGTAELGLKGPIFISDVLLAVCTRIKVGYDTAALHA